LTILGDGLATTAALGDNNGTGGVKVSSIDKVIFTAGPGGKGRHIGSMVFGDSQTGGRISIFFDNGGFQSRGGIFHHWGFNITDEGYIGRPHFSQFSQKNI
jgi:hypothetical protein